MSPLLIINHTLALVLEIVLLVLLGMWGHGLVAGPWLNWVSVLLVLAAAIALWGRFAAPKSVNRFKMPGLLIFKIAVFGAGTLAAWTMGQPLWAAVFGIVSVVHLALAVWLDAV